MLTPEGLSANKTDKIMLLAMWANALKIENDNSTSHNIKKNQMIFAGIGKPTYPINPYIIQSQLSYWKRIERLAKNSFDHKKTAIESAAIDYGDPYGDINSRIIMASAMSKWYGVSIKPNNIIFTAGGAGALRVIFETFNLIYKNHPKYRVITPFPHYTLYADNSHQLHPIDVMRELGYKLTAQSLLNSIEKAYVLAKSDNAYPRFFLLCNPNNPLGTIVSKDELEKIAEVLRKYPEIFIVLDEAYAEMSFEIVKIPSLLALAPDLKDRIIILRSATKALSAAGERMAILIAFNDKILGKLLDKNIGIIGHAPRSGQIAYSEAMANFTDEIHQNLIDFYKQKVEYVTVRLKQMGAQMPDPEYKVNGTFYILGDFSDLLGMNLPENAERALEKIGLVRTNEDIAYYLLFKDSLMIAPTSYFGLPKNNGYMRITCSGSQEELIEMMDRLESRLFYARTNQKNIFLEKISLQLSELKNVNLKQHETSKMLLLDLSLLKSSCLELKEQNNILKKQFAENLKLINKSHIDAYDTLS